MGWFGVDRRQTDRRAESGQTDAAADGERRDNDRRRIQRRQHFRVSYPPTASPEIINIPAQVIDLSIKAVRFIPNESSTLSQDLKNGSRLKMSFKFQDGQTVEMSGTLLRQVADTEGKNFYVYIFNTDFPMAILNKEQSYLLKNFPDFCREKFRPQS